MQELTGIFITDNVARSGECFTILAFAIILVVLAVFA